jgi:hypothetical protein
MWSVVQRLFGILLACLEAEVALLPLDLLLFGQQPNGNQILLSSFTEALSIQDSPIHSERTLVHKQSQIHEDLQMNTVLSEIKK